MGERIPVIKEFPNDDQQWRVNWFGALERNYAIPTQPTIQVSLSPIVDSGLKLSSNQAVDHSQKKLISIGVGQLPYVSIGSIWKNGIIQNSHAGDNTTFNDLLISETSVQEIDASAIINGAPILSSIYHPAALKKDSNKCFAISWKGDPHGIIIPAMEVIRFYYAISTDLSLSIFSGELFHNLGQVINPEKSGFLQSNDLYSLHLRRNFSDNDGWVIARILQSPEAYKGAKAVHDTLIKESINYRWLYPSSGFPFKGVTNLSCLTKSFKCGEKWKKLVLAITYCTGPFPFCDLHIDRDNRGIKANPKSDIPEEEKKAAYPSKSPSPTGKEINIQNQLPSDASMTSIEIPLPTMRFGAIADKKILKSEVDQCFYKNTGFQSTKQTLIEEYGTDQGNYSSSEIGRLEFSTLPPKKERAKGISASFTFIEEIIKAINEFEGIKASIRTPTDEIEFIPLCSKSEKRQWSYLDSEDKTRRRVFIGDIAFKEMHYCLIDFEHRNTGERSAGLIHLRSKAEISDRVMKTILWALAKKIGVWKNITIFQNQLVIQSLKHTRSTPEQFAEAIMDRIRNIL